MAPVLAPAPPTGNTFTSDTLVEALQNNGNRRKNKTLCTGNTRISGLFMCGVMDMKTSNIATLAILQPTTGHDEYCAKTIKEDKAAAMKCMLDSNNKARPIGDPIVVYQMEQVSGTH